MLRRLLFVSICAWALGACGDDSDSDDGDTGDGDGDGDTGDGDGDGDTGDGDGDGDGDVCGLPFDSGPCDAAIPVFWYSVSTGRCEERSYGGCEGNDNRFDTLAACDAACVDLSAVECEVEADCGWGEIAAEINSPRDCICLYGCPYLPLNTATIQRRQQQHDTHCEPSEDGQGNPCGIDDCISPPTAMCVEGRCTGELGGG